jgi:hypothetical protein
VCAAADDPAAADGGLRAFAEGMVPIGAHLSYLWRNPMFDRIEDIDRRWRSVEPLVLALLKRAGDRGLVRRDVPDFWLLQTFYSLVYVATESVRSGHLAPRDAPDLVVDTFLRGLGAPQP